MAQQSTKAAIRPHLLLARTVSPVVGVGVVLSAPQNDLLGYRRIKGYFRCDVAPAAGFPRVRLGGSALVGGAAVFDEVIVLVQDFTQLPVILFPFELLIERWVDINWTTGGVAGTLLRGWAVALPE